MVDVNRKLLKAAWIGNVDEVREAIESGADIETVGSYHSGTALNAAARNGHVDVLRLLIG